MKTHLSLTELATELERRSKAKQDFVAPTTSLTMTAASNELIIGDAKNNDATVLAVNDIAHGQIADRLGIPQRYYGKLREEQPALLANNVNTLLHAKREERMVRTLDGKVRAFLSNKYQRIENEEIANAVLPELMQQDVKIESCSITETRMYIKAVFPKIEGEIVKGDVVQAGIVISNSEVGMGMVSIQPLVYRLVCTNGLIIPDSKFGVRHVGGRAQAGDGIYEMLSSEALQADDRAVLLKVRDVIRGSFDQVQFGRYLDRMREVAGEEIEGNPVEAVKLLAKKVQLNEAEQSSVLRHLIKDGDLTRWGILNAVTRSAQDADSYDRATELETLGGTILNLPKTQWREIAQAA